MRRVLLVAALALVPCAAFAQKPMTRLQRDALADSIDFFAGEVLQAISKHNVEKFVDAHVASPELVYAAAGKIYPDRDSLHRELKAYFASPAAQQVSFSKGKTIVQVLDTNNAVVTAWVDSRNVDANGSERKGHEVWSIVVSRRNNEWKIVQAHESYPRTPPAQ